MPYFTSSRASGDIAAFNSFGVIMKTCAIIASGPSAADHDMSVLDNIDVIAINDSWQLYKKAKILYACDRRWWEYHNFVPEFKGLKYTQNKGWGEECPKDLIVLESENKSGLCKGEGKIYNGSNSGHQAINLAVNLGYTKLILIGYDCRVIDNKSHWFGDHPGKLNKKSPYDLFIKAFNVLAMDLKKEGIEVINCSEHSAINCFEKGDLYETAKT